MSEEPKISLTTIFIGKLLMILILAVPVLTFWLLKTFIWEWLSALLLIIPFGLGVLFLPHLLFEWKDDTFEYIKGIFSYLGIALIVTHLTQWSGFAARCAERLCLSGSA